MSDQPIHMSSGLPTTVLPEPDVAISRAMTAALNSDDPRSAIASVVADHPRSSEAWAAWGDHGRDVVERYAAYRVG
jgi:hypothetical protein